MSKADIVVGAAAPDFTLPDEAGKPMHLSDFRGKRVVLYFYPKDDTP
nr:redoxin domain-containing protein [Ktedonobacterales bacterium]